MEASIRHDLKTLRSMTSEDIVWKLGPYTLVGRDAALGPNAYDAGMETELEYSNVIVNGDVVEFELVERSDEIRAVGMHEVHHYPRFVYEKGLLKRKEPWKLSPDAGEASRRVAPLRRWIRENHPEAIEKLLDSKGNFIFNKDNGALMRDLANEWRERNDNSRDQGDR